jgi:SAM-dependent methyltransferase
MAFTHTRAPRPRVGGSSINEIARFEAPDRRFAGHRDILTRSLARYHLLAQHARGDLLDVGCGRGYGFDVLRDHTASHTGVDISLEFLREACSGYRSAAFAQTTGERLPFRAGSFDTIIAFEVIEHLQDDLGFLSELKRLLRPGGVVAVSTPNRLVSSGGQKAPLNPFHVREYLANEFETLLRQAFAGVSMFGQHDRAVRRSGRSSLVDRIPVSWKYLLPSHIQGMMSIALRPPLQLADCVFFSDELDAAHTFVAVCTP